MMLSQHINNYNKKETTKQSKLNNNKPQTLYNIFIGGGQTTLSASFSLLVIAPATTVASCRLLVPTHETMKTAGP